MNTLSEMKNTLKGIKNKLHEAEDQITELEVKVAENAQSEQQKDTKLKTMRIKWPTGHLLFSVANGN